jgi:hypothetical protein
MCIAPIAMRLTSIWVKSMAPTIIDATSVPTATGSFSLSLVCHYHRDRKVHLAIAVVEVLEIAIAKD